jgi:two-component system sensor histidine kinase MtrB
MPGIAVGAPVNVRGIAYELYHVFPLDEEQRTLDLVQRTLLVAGGVLVLLVGLIAYVVTRQVVTPVRWPRGSPSAGRGSAGGAHARRGEDDLARSRLVHKMATNLQRQIRELEDLSRVQRRFVSDVSHELRTPLTPSGWRRCAARVAHRLRARRRASAELLQAQLDRFERCWQTCSRSAASTPGPLCSSRADRPARDRPARHRRGAAIAESGGAALEAPTLRARGGRPARIERVLRNLVVNASNTARAGRSR